MKTKLLVFLILSYVSHTKANEEVFKSQFQITETGIAYPYRLECHSSSVSEVGSLAMDRAERKAIEKAESICDILDMTPTLIDRDNESAGCNAIINEDSNSSIPIVKVEGIFNFTCN